MGNYSSSPGAIYPALQRLEVDQLILGRVEETAGLRRRRLYSRHRRGRSRTEALAGAAYRARPMSGAAADELMLRFGFMEQVLGTIRLHDFLVNFGKALKPYIAELEAFLTAQAGSMPLSGRLALECGIRSYRSLHEWTGYAFGDVSPIAISLILKPC